MWAKVSVISRVRRPPKGRVVGERDHRRAHDAGIDEFRCRQTLRIAVARGGRTAGHDRDQVGGGGADIDQEGVRGDPPGERRGGVPVGRGHVGGAVSRRLRGDEAGPAGIDPHGPGEMRPGPAGQRRHARPPVGEAIG